MPRAQSAFAGPLAGWLVLLALVLLAWLASSAMFPYAVPGLLDVASYLAGMDPLAVAGNVVVTLENALAGYLLASVAAVVSVAASLYSRLAASVVDALNRLVQSISALVWALVSLAVFGVTSRAPAVVVSAATAYPILLSVLLAAARSLREAYRDLARMTGMRAWHELVYIVVPGSLPAYAAASRSALGAALRISVVAEAFSAAGGVGYRLAEAYSLGDVEGMYAWALLLVVLMLVVDALLLSRLEAVAKRWAGAGWTGA